MAEQQRVGDAIDIRRTMEARRRAIALSDRLHLVPDEVLAEEIGMAP